MIPPLEAGAHPGANLGSGGQLSLGRVTAFDGVRGVAVLLVLWFHSGIIRVLTPSQRPLGGFLGVDVFFVLSGFLITALLLREQSRWQRVRFGAFYRRRAMRLFPVLVAFVVAHLVFAWALRLAGGPERSSILSLLFYYTNWKAAWWPPLTLAFGHLWSLAIEEQFYLVWPIVVALLGVRARLRTVTLVLVVTIAAVACRRAILWEHGVSWSRLGLGLDTHADPLLIGALLAYLWTRGRVPKRGVAPAAWISVVFICLCFARCHYNGSFLYLGGYTLFAIAVAIVLLAVLETNWVGNRFLELRPLRAVGRVSYGLYVWHPLIFVWVTYYTVRWSEPARLTLVATLTAVVTYGSWKLIEQPFLRWKDRIEQTGRPRLATTHPSRAN